MRKLFSFEQYKHNKESPGIANLSGEVAKVEPWLDFLNPADRDNITAIYQILSQKLTHISQDGDYVKEKPSESRPEITSEVEYEPTVIAFGPSTSGVGLYRTLNLLIEPSKGDVDFATDFRNALGSLDDPIALDADYKFVSFPGLTEVVHRTIARPSNHGHSIKIYCKNPFGAQNNKPPEEWMEAFSCNNRHYVPLLIAGEDYAPISQDRVNYLS